jgi:sec-independent protein translocase protein TatA
MNWFGDILQPTHLLFILVVALLVLGPKRLPEVGRSLGRGLRDFRAAMSGEETRPQDQLAVDAPPAPQAAPAPAVTPAEPVQAAPTPGATPAESVQPPSEPVQPVR